MSMSDMPPSTTFPNATQFDANFLATVPQTNQNMNMINMSESGSGSFTFNPEQQKNIKNAIKDFLIIIVVYIIIRIIILIWAIHCILTCASSRGWNSLVAFLLIVLLFIPGLGDAICIGIIIYYYASGCHKKNLSFTFY